ncbi:MAG: DUF4136 domain-containing protein [Colwellia sp.]|nr:DUF4136 domain-containing protein [Colwellia sp.]
MTQLTLILPLILASVLAGCVQVIEEYPMRKTQLAVSSTRDLPITFPSGSKFALSPKYLKEASIKPEQLQNIYKLYSNEIIADFTSEGFLLARTDQRVDFYVGFGVALSEDLSDETINEKFGVSPGLPENSENEKGSFLIYVDDATTGQRIWRGTAQGFVQNDFTAEQRKERVARVVDMLLAQYHNSKE